MSRRLMRIGVVVASMAAGWTVGCFAQAGDAAVGGGADAGGGAEGEGTGTNIGTNTGTGGDAGATVAFEAVDSAAALRKVKALVNGGVPTDDEFAALALDANALPAMVEAWQATDGYKTRLLRFFSAAFQQSNVTSMQMVAGLDDSSQAYDDAMVANFREMFGRTAVALTQQNKPFTDLFTTNQFMMTSALMSYFSWSDATLVRDNGAPTHRYVMADPNFQFSYTNSKAIALEDTANFSGPNAWVFGNPALGQNLFRAVQNNNYNTAPAVNLCKTTDPVVFSRTVSFNGPGSQMRWLYRMLRGEQFYASLDANTYCIFNPGGFTVPYRASDFNDWRMVQMQPTNTGLPLPAFFNLPVLRVANALQVNTPQVGFFTMPAFWGQWSINASNSTRATLNQALIVALGKQIVPTALTGTVEPAVDVSHAGDAACLSCHQPLDPMRQFFRQSYSLHYSAQQNQQVIGTPAHFSFLGLEADGNGVADFGAILARHPGLADAWTAKTCGWLNSGPCGADGNGLAFASATFRQSGYNFNALVKALVTSGAVSYASVPDDANAPQRVSIARRSQACQVLATRLNMPDVCQQSHLFSGTGTSLGDVAANVPEDTYGRGVNDGIYSTAPEPFYRSSLERLCAAVAPKAVDNDLGGWSIASIDPNAAAAAVAQNLLGLAPNERAVVVPLLRQSVLDAQAAGASPSVATQSMFVAACTSPLVGGIGL